METGVLNGNDLKKMLDSGLALLAERYKEVDSLNVFPVPDGDTGTNMYMTLSAAVQEAGKAGDLFSAGQVAEYAARGALMGARGNSGVILSQLLRGIALGLKDKDNVSGKVLAQAFDLGVKTAFKSIIKPVEGTILTVAREAAKESVKAAVNRKSLTGILEAACQKAEEILRLTPSMLPALKAAGVVDAGGMGWVIILRGFTAGLQDDEKTAGKNTENSDIDVRGKPAGNVYSGIPKTAAGSDLKFPYCTEVLVKLTTGDISGLQDKLVNLGDSLMVVNAEDYTRIHLHSGHPGQVLEICLQYGSLSNVKITNMNEQVFETRQNQSNTSAGLSDTKFAAAGQQKKYGIVAVSQGEGLSGIMKSLGADILVTGGQTMNPSTQELLEAVEKTDAEAVIILPNNSNIIMTARQVADFTSKKISVIPAQTIPQGIAALLAVTPEVSADDLIKNMTSAISAVKTGEVTYAVRDTQIDGNKIDRDSIIGLFDGDILVSGKEVPEVVQGLLAKMISVEDEICTLYYGNMITASEAESLINTLQEMFAEIEFELHAGGQPLYYYIISIE